jgi:hypothetical protein
MDNCWSASFPSELAGNVSLLAQDPAEIRNRAHIPNYHRQR